MIPFSRTTTSPSLFPEQQLVRGLITNIQRFSVNDGPGIRTTIFMKGCSLKCQWCHNPECQEFYTEIFFRQVNCRHEACGHCAEVCPVGAIDIGREQIIDIEKCNLCMKCVEVCPYKALIRVGKLVSVGEVLKEVERDSLFYLNSGGGVTVSGGEPLQQPIFVKTFLQLCKHKSIHTALDTAGFTPRDITLELSELSDLILYDIKHMDPKRHKAGTGFSNELILENAKSLADHSMNVKMRIRVPIIPDFNDSEEDIQDIACFAKSLGIEWVDILPYHRYGEAKYKMLGRDYSLQGTPDLIMEKVIPLERIFQHRSLKTTIGG